MDHIEPSTTLVLLPGLMCDQAVWTRQCEYLSSRTRSHVVSYGTINRIERMAAHVLATAPAERFALAGHSMGGRVALEVLRQAPHRVERLCLLDTGFDSIAPGTKGEAEREGRYALLAQARADGMRAMGKRWARGMVHSSKLDSPLFEEVLAMIERSSVEIFEAQIDALIRRPDATELLPAIAVPTLLLCGTEDTWSPPERHEVMRQAIPGSRLSLIADSGHMSTMEKPEAVSVEMAAWLVRSAGNAA